MVTFYSKHFVSHTSDWRNQTISVGTNAKLDLDHRASQEFRMETSALQGGTKHDHEKIGA